MPASTINGSTTSPPFPNRVKGGGQYADEYYKEVSTSQRRQADHYDAKGPFH